MTDAGSDAMRRSQGAGEPCPASRESGRGNLTAAAGPGRRCGYLSMGDKALRALIMRGELPFVQTIAGQKPILTRYSGSPPLQ
jgi:hypothetical protein